MAQSRATVLEKKVRKRSEGGKRKWHFPLAAAVPNEAGGGSDREKRSPTPLPSSPGSAIAGCVALLPHPRRPVFKSPPPAGRLGRIAAAAARHRGTTSSSGHIPLHAAAPPRRRYLCFALSAARVRGGSLRVWLPLKPPSSSL